MAQFGIAVPSSDDPKIYKDKDTALSEVRRPTTLGELWGDAVAPADTETNSLKTTEQKAAPRTLGDIWGERETPVAKTETQTEPAPAPTTDSGDTGRGFKNALQQTPAMLKGMVGFAGAAGEKAFGEGGMFSSLKQYGLEGYKKEMASVQARSKETDDVTTAWERAKAGDLGALVDWAQYGVGYLAGNVVETAGTALLGAMAGSAVAPGAGTVAGATAGVAGKAAVKSAAKNLIESLVSKEAAKLAEKAGTKAVTEDMMRQATKSVARNIGATTAMAGSSILKETGSIYGDAEEEAAKTGRKLDGGDLARIFAAGTLAGLTEVATDKLGLDAVTGKVKIPGTGKVGKAIIGGAAGLGIEGGQEVLQTVIERVGADKSLNDNEAFKDYINSFALGGLGGGVTGTVSGALQRPERKPMQDSDKFKQMLSEGEQALAQNPQAEQPIEQMAAEQQPVPDVVPNPQAANTSVESVPGASQQQEQVDPRARFHELDAMARGADSIAMPGPDGNPVTVPIEARALTKNEMAEYEQLKQQFMPNREAQAQAQPEPAAPTIASPIDEAAHQAATSPLNDKPQPTAAQKEKGNYPKGHLKFQGLDIAVESPQGSTRSGVGTDGKPWETTMANHYGYIKGSVGKDKDHVDVFIGPNPDSGKVFVVDQVSPDGKFDEHKALVGFDSAEEAAAAYKSNYSADWQGLGAISEMPIDAFKSWVKDGEKRKPLALPKQDVTLASEGKTDGALTNEGTKTEPAPATPTQQTAVTAQEKPVAKQTVEQKVKEKAKAKKAEAKAETQTKASDAKAMQKAAEQKAQKAADKALGKKKVSKEAAVEFWEDNDDGTAPHIAWRDLPREFQLDWKEAMEDGYASADLHDKLVAAAKQNGRAAKANDKVAKAKQDTDVRDAYRLTEAPKRGMLADEVQKVYDVFKKHVAITPNVIIVQDETGLPVKMRNQIAKEGIEGKVPGAFSNGKVYLIASNLNGAKDVMLTLTHEIAGHFGLRSILGKDHTTVMRSIYEGNAYVRKMADQMVQKEGLSVEMATEEVLADIAEIGGDLTADQKSALQKIIQAIRVWLRETFGVKFVSDAEVKQIIAKARRYVVEGDVQAGEGGVSAADFSIAMRERAPVFYSAMEKGIGAAKQESAQAKDWIAIIKNMPGVKADEVEWTGVNDWLALQTGKVTKQQVLDFVALNKIKLNDLILEGEGEYISDADLRALLADNYSGEDMPFDPVFMDREELLMELGIENADGTKYGQSKWTLPGGKEHVELVLIDPAAKKFKANDDTHFGDLTNGKTIGWFRANVRKDVSGNDVLFVEELQSQRGQEGNEKGFVKDGQLPADWEVVQDEQRGWYVLDKSKTQIGHYAKTKQEAIDVALKAGVPDGPFVKDKRVWTSLLLKRVVSYALSKGIDRVAWTTGEQQNDRYKLTKQVDQITYVKDKKTGKIEISGTKDGRTVMTKEVEQNNLASVVGGEMAEQINSNTGVEIENEYETSGIIEGEDLEVHDKDLRPYYNTTVPSVAKDLLKKFGGAVEIMDIETTGQQLGFVVPDKMKLMVAQEGLPMFRRRDAEAQFSDLPQDTRDIIDRKFSPKPPGIRERIEYYRPNLGRRLVQGLFDPFRSIKDVSEKAYQQARMTTSVDGAVEGMVHYGQVFNDDGALNLKKGTKGLLEVMEPLGHEVDRFLMWVAANRAAKLTAEQRERLFTPDEIKKLQALNLGKTSDGKARTALYAEVLRGMNDLNRSVLDIAKEAGMIDEAAYKRFTDDIWYVPFYRQMDEEGKLSGMMTAASLTGQQFSKRLRGSERPLNDLMANVLMNWSHILSSSMKNNAAVETLKAAQSLGVVSTASPKDKGAVEVMVNGKPEYFMVDDEFLLDSLHNVTTWQQSNWFVDVARGFKTTFTRLISLNPTFKINNLIRDSIQSVGISELEGNPVANAFNGYRAYHGERAEALIGGGLFSMGNAFDGDRSEAVKRLVAKGVDPATILNTPEKAKEFMHKLWDKYDEISDAAENANRLSLYKQLRAKGATHLEAAYAARDLQDFSLRGSFGAVRYLTQMVPYMNARMQGLYKLGRAAEENPRRFATVAGAVTLAGLTLYLAQKDDDDWKKREEWDRDMFFWFKLPGTDTAIRIPKPFEMGAISTVAERLLEQMVDEGVEGKVFGQRMIALLSDNFAINPMPQVFKPVYDVARNKDGFTDRPIESMGMERLSAENRKNPGTSGVAVALGTVNSMLADGISAITGVQADKMKWSPIQYDYLMRGYLGWLGTVIQTSSVLVNDAIKEGESPRFRQVDDFFVVGNFVKKTPQPQSKYVTSFYENAKAIAEAQADYVHFMKMGKLDEAMETVKSKGDLIALNKLYTKAQTDMADISKQIKLVEDNKEMSGEAKRQTMNRLGELRSELARQVEAVRVMLKRQKQ